MRLRIVIPTLNEARHLPPTLQSIREQDLPATVVVVDGGSQDDTERLARSYGVEVLRSTRGRGHQLRVGARGAREDVLLFLHADTVLPRGGLSAVDGVLRKPRVVGGRFRIRFDHDHHLLRLGSYLSRFRVPLFSYGDQGMFVRREVYERIGGFEDVPLFEDVGFYRRLRRAGKVRVLPLAVTTSGRRFRRRGPWRQMIENTALVAAHRLGISPVRLAGYYERLPDPPRSSG